MKKFIIPVLGFLSVFGLFAFDVLPVLAQAPGGPTSSMINATDNMRNVESTTSFEGSSRGAALTIVNYFLYFLGLLATIMVIYGGFLYITAGGEETEKAKKVLLYSAIGIIIILISFALVNTILGAGDEAGTGRF